MYAYSQNTQHPDLARGGQEILHTHLFTTPMLGQRRKWWPVIVSKLGQCLVLAAMWSQACSRQHADQDQV